MTKKDKPGASTPQDQAEADARAKAEADAREKAEAEAWANSGPVCKDQVMYRKRLFAIGDHLPSDTPREILAQLRQAGCID